MNFCTKKVGCMLTIDIDKLFDGMFILLIISVFFDAYCFNYIATYPVTVFTIASVLFCIVSVIRCLMHKTKKTTKESGIAIVMMLYIFLNTIMTGTFHITSALFSWMFFFIFICAYRDYNEEVFNLEIKVFQIIMNILAIYGIYQLVGRILGLPFTDLKIPGHMVTGFNWGNYVSIAGLYVMRSNAIFREPSFFSQYLAVNILIYIARLITSKKTNVPFLIINIIAMICSFSGTGILLLGTATILFFIRTKKDARSILKILILVIIAIIGLLFLSQTTLGYYFVSRISEILTYNPNDFSGYVRFRSGADVLSAAWNKNLILGIGIGSVEEFMHSLINYYDGMTVHGFYRVAVELGAVGLWLWLYFIYRCFSKEGYENTSLLVIECILFPMMICHETFQSNYYWVFLFLLNFTKHAPHQCTMKNNETSYEKSMVV